MDRVQIVATIDRVPRCGGYGSARFTRYTRGKLSAFDSVDKFSQSAGKTAEGKSRPFGERARMIACARARERESVCVEAINAYVTRLV